MASIPHDPVRKLIASLIRERGLDMADISRRLNKNHAYIQQFIERGVPRELREKDRSALAELLGVDEARLGGKAASKAVEFGDGGVKISQYNVHAAAGAPVTIDKESTVGTWILPGNYIRHALSLNPAKLALIEVKGDSMEPTLMSGDLIMVDMSDIFLSQPGIFALYDGDGTVVKRIEKIPGSNPPKIRLISDNKFHTSYDVPHDVVKIAGRVVWLGRRL